MEGVVLRSATDLPEFNDARTGVDASQLTPPFDFDSVMMRVFPLRARLERIQAFIDAYLNIAPDEVAHFRAFLPYAYLMIINYGKMSVDAANLGWISQNEVAFSVPLLWYKKIDGRLVFHDFAYVSPFIYVDNDLSMTTGREVYGWPKSRVSVDTLATAWMKSPEASPVLARFSAMVLPELYAGMRHTARTLLEIKYSMEAGFARAPFNPRADWLPWVGVPKAITGSVEMMRDYADVLRGLGFVREQPGAGPMAYASMLTRLSRSFKFYRPDIGFNTINVKQFRDAEHPNAAAYQAITNARMSLRRFQGGGLLGDRHVLTGDSSGGFSVDVHQYPTAPIVEALGLEVAAERTISGLTVHTLRPVFPMWLDVDMRYDVGRAVAWRAKGMGWFDAEGTPLSTRGNAGADECRYNTARGAAEVEVAGPFTFPNATLRVMPLLADEDKLASFLRGYLGEPLSSEGIEVLPWGRYVYLVASSYEEMSSMTNDIGWWADRELIFYVPAKVLKNGELYRVALVPAYAFANSATAALTGAEVSGIPVAKSELSSPGNPWMGDQGPGLGTKRALLSASTMVLPVVELGQKAVERVLVEVLEGDPLPREDEERWRIAAQGWGQKMKEELWRKKQDIATEERLDLFTRKACTFALEVLCKQRPIHLLTLKQFRDAEQPTKACYQAIVEIDRAITHIHHIEEIESGLHVRIHHYPTQPIVETLGLVTMTEEVAPGGVLVHVLEPARPFWAKVSLKENLGRNMFVRAGTGAWHDSNDRGAATAPPPSVGTLTVSAIQAWYEPRRLAAIVDDLSHNDPARAGPPVTEPDIEEVVGAFGPQAIIESILSEEWERWDECRWRRARARIERECAEAREGKTPMAAAMAEFEAFRSIMTKALELRAVERKLRAIERKITETESLLAVLLQHRLHEFFGIQRSILGGDTGDYYTRLRGEIVETYRRSVLQLDPALNERIAVPKYEDGDYGDMSEEDWNRVFRWGISVPTFDEDLRKLEAMSPDDLNRAIRIHAREAESVYNTLCMLLAKTHQKPYYVIRRAAIANENERERTFPMKDCWDEEWYIGPPVKSAAPGGDSPPGGTP